MILYFSGTGNSLSVAKKTAVLTGDTAIHISDLMGDGTKIYEAIKTNLDRAETLCTSNVTDMLNLFYNNTSFNQPIGNWDTSNVTNMDRMFFDTKYFNQDISNWNVSNVTNMNGMFYESKNFNSDISKWDVSNVNNSGRRYTPGASRSGLLSLAYKF